MASVLAVWNAAGGSSQKPVLELLGGGRTLAEALGLELAVAALGADVPGAADLGAYGARRVYTVTNPLLGEYQADLFLAALEAVCRQAEPAIVLFSGDAAGRELGPRLARRLGGAVVTDCVELRVENGDPRYVRPVYGGKAMSVVRLKKSPHVVTVRPRSLEAAQPAGGAAEVVAVSVSLDAAVARTRVVERLQEEVSGVRLEDAKVVVSGGRGLGGPENFRMLEDLARVVNGAVGASRAAVDAGWVPASMQVGQTGKIVAPDLYVAVGISGASQHLAGMSGSKHIVAINKDGEAPIFKVAELGVVEDYRKVVPVLTEKLKELLGR